MFTLIKSGKVAASTSSKTDSDAAPQTTLTPAQLQYGRRLMTQEGTLWAIMNAIAVPGGLVLTGFALYMGADAFVLGLVSALPLIAALLQLWTPQFLVLLGSRKRVTIYSLAIARLLLLPLTALALVAWLLPEQKGLWLILFLVILTLSSGFTAIGGTTWLSWAATMVPLEKRASYFARRSTIVGLMGLVVTLAAGTLLDNWKKTPNSKEADPAAYFVLMLVAAIFSLTTIFLLKKTPDIATAPPPGIPRPKFQDSLIATWKLLPLRNYLIFRAVWLFAVGLVLPYYTVYMLQNLHLSFTEISILQNAGMLAMLIVTPFWGQIADKYGNSRVIYWTSWFKVFYILLWALIIPGQPFWPLLALHLTLVVDAGLTLSSGNLLMNLMPSHGAENVGYFSVFVAATSVISSIGPFLAGITIGIISGNQVNLLGMEFGAIQVIFLASGVLRAVSLLFFRGFDDKPQVVGA
jgi:MFS family permease